MHAFRLLVLLLALLMTSAHAQSTRLTAVHAAGTFQVRFALLDMRIAGGRASLGVHYGTAPGLALHLRNTTTFGPLGNVIVDLDAAGTIGVGAAASLAARATAGPFALRLRLHAANSDHEPQLREPDRSLQPMPIAEGAFTWGVQLGATWRASRELQLLFDPSIVGKGGGLAVVLPLEVQLQRFVADHDLRLRVSTLVSLSGAAGPVPWSSAGVGLHIDRGRAAAWDAWLLLGGTAERISPGLSFDVLDAVAGGQLRAGVVIETWRSEVDQLRLGIGWTGEVQDMVLDVYARASAPTARIEAGASLSWPLD